MATVRELRPIVSSAPEKPRLFERSNDDRASASHAPACDRIERGTRERRTASTPYLSLGVDFGFLIDVQASLTLAGGKLYGSIGGLSGVVPGVGASLETGSYGQIAARPTLRRSKAPGLRQPAVSASVRKRR